MSDSLAGLAINVNVQQIKAATEALDKLAEKAGEVEKKVNNIGGGTPSSGRQFNTQNQMLREAEKQQKQIDSINRHRLTEQTRVERAIQASETRLNGIIGRANRQLPRLEAGNVIKEAERITKAYQDIVRSTAASGVLFETQQGIFKRGMQTASGEIARQGGLLRNLNDNAKMVSASFGAANNSLGGFSRVLFQTGAALASLAGAFALREITQSIMEFERFSNTLRTVSGSTQEFQRNMTFLIAEANRIGFGIGEVGNSFARFSLAMQGAGFTNDQVRLSFTQLAEASRNFGLSSADTMGVIRALEQSMSKGKFMAEEVRLQLGDRLPIAMAALERAVTRVDGKQSDINKRFEEGSIDVARYGQEFIRQINLMSGGAETLSRTQNTIAAAFGRLNTEASLSAQAFGEGGFSNAVIMATSNLVNLLSAMREYGVIETFGSAMEQAAKYADILAVALGLLAGGLILRTLGSLALSLASFTPLVAAAATVIGSLTAAYVLFARNTPSRSVIEFNAASSSLNSTLEQSQNSLNSLNATLTRGGQSLDGNASAAERAIQVNVRLGNSYIEAARKVAEAELQTQQARASTLAAEVAAQRAAYAQRISSERSVGSFLSGSASSLRRNEQLQGVLQNQAPSEENAAARMRLVDQRSALMSVREIVNQVQLAQMPIQEAVESIRRTFQGANIPREVQNIINSFEEMAADPSFQAIGNRLQQDKVRFEEVTRAAEALRAALQTPMVANVLINSPFQEYIYNQAIQSGQYGGEGYFPTPTGTSGVAPNPRTTFSPNRLLPENPGVRVLRESAARAGRGFANRFTDTMTFQQALGEYRTQFGGTPEGVRIIQDAIKANDRGQNSSSGGNTNRVEEAMHDLRLQNGRAGIESGTAEAAGAEAIKRVADAAKLETQAFERSAQAAEVRRLVAERLNKEMELAIRLMARETTNNNRLAQAYLQSNEAGRAMEITIRAEAEARKYARETGTEYTEALRLMTAEIEKNVASEQNMNAARQMREGRNDIEVLELEGRLITSNTAARNAEVAVLRARQQYAGADEATLARLETQIRQTEQLRSRNEQLTNSWTEVSRLGEQAFERIGSAITEALAQGRLEGISFKNVMKAVFSEVAQAALKLAVINPILNAAFGGTRGTLGGAFNAVGASDSTTGVSGGSGGGTFSLSNIGSALGVGRQAYNSFSGGGLGSFFPGGSAVNTGFGGVDGLLNTSLVSPTIVNISPTVGAAGTFLPAGVSGPVLGAPTLATTSGGLSLAQSLGPAAGIAGGAYGIYSGIQKGGLGGGLQIAGGAAGVGLGLASLGALGTIGTGVAAALGPAGWAAIAALAIAGALLPGQKPSGMGQLSKINLNSGLESTQGLGGKRFSQGNLDIASNTVDSIVNSINALGDKLGGARIGGDLAVGVTNDKLYIDVNGQKANFANTEEGAKQLAETAARMVFNEFKGQGTTSGDIRGILDASGTAELLDANLTWYEDVYKVLIKSADAASAFDKQMEEMLKPFDEAIAKAKELALSTDKLTDARQKEIDNLNRQLMFAQQEAAYNVMGRQITSGIFGDETYGRAADLVSGIEALNAAKEIQEFQKSLENLSISAEGVTYWVNALAQVQNLEISNRAAEVKRQREYGVNTTLSDLMLRAEAAGLGGDLGALRETRRSLETENNVANLFKQLRELGLSVDMSNYLTDYLRTIESAEYAAEMQREAAETQREAAETLKNLSENARQSATSSISSLLGYARSLSFSEASPLSARSRYDLALNQFNTTSSAALGGDARSITNLQSYSEQLLTAGRDMFGSGSEYARLFDQVLNTISGVASMGEDTLTASFMAQIQETSTQTLATELQALRAEVVGLRNQVAQQQTTPVRA